MRSNTEVKKPRVSQQEIATPNDCNSLKKKPALSYTRGLTYTAALTALALILKLVGQIWGGALMLFNLKLSFIYIAWILSAVILGPLGGMAVGFLSDVLGTFLLPTTGGILPLLVISNTLFPLFIGIAVKYIPIKNLFLKIVIGTVVSMLVCTLGITTLGLSLNTMGEVPFFAMLATRWPQPIVITLNLVIVGALLPVLKRLKIISEI